MWRFILHNPYYVSASYKVAELKTERKTAKLIQTTAKTPMEKNEKIAIGI